MIIVKYTYRPRDLWASNINFPSIMEAIHWVKEKRRDRRFMLLGMTYQADKLYDDTSEFGKTARGYRYEGSTDAELLGIRY